MKKNYILLFTIFTLSLFSQKDYSRYYNAWRLGINGGVSWQTADIRSCYGGAGGFTLERGLNENATNFFSFAIRGRYLGANTYGMSSTKNYDIKANDAYNGTYNKVVNYYDSVPSYNRYIYDNYKTKIGEGSLELQITFNRLREKKHVLLNLWGGVGITSYRTMTNMLDANGKMYDFSKVDSTGTALNTISSFNSLTDNSYESDGLGSKSGNITTFSPSGGVGLGYQFSGGFSLLWEYKITLPQGINADLLDGRFGNNNDKIGGNKDYYHYTGLNLLFTLRSKNKTKNTAKKDDEISNYTSVPTNTIAPTNSLTPSPIVISNPTPTLSKPVITYITPPVNGQKTNTSLYKISAQILNIDNKGQIKFYYNSNLISNYSFNSSTHILEYTTYLNLGSNPIQIIATNTAGSDNKSTTVIYEKSEIVQPNNPPTIIITNPRNCPFVSTTQQFTLLASAAYISTKEQISVKINNVFTSNFTFNSSNGLITLPLNLLNGNNNISISVTNNFGSNVATCAITYNEPKQQLPAPIITIVNPAQSGYLSSTQNYQVNATILNVPASTNISLYYNGVSTPFNYNVTTKQFSFLASLNEGNNDVAISAFNSSGEDNKSTKIVYHAPVQQGNPPVINLIAPNQVNSFQATPLYNFNFGVLNINSKNDITMSFNGTIVNSFNYNPQTREVLVDQYLIAGTNTLSIKANNAFGTDSKIVYVGFQPRVASIKNPPKVTFTAPISSPSNAVFLDYVYKASITNIPNSSGLSVKYNGQIITNYSYNGSLFTYSASLIGGDNTLEITASNNDGKDVATAIVNRKVKQNVLLPIVSLMNPMFATSTTSNVIYNFKMAVINVASQNDIEVTFNGVVQNSFTYNTSTTLVEFTSNLNLGNNVLTVKGTNSNGSDSKTVNVVYEPVIITKKPPVITFVTPAVNTNTITNPTFIFDANITNAPSTSNLVVKYNGLLISNYVYNGSQLTYSAILVGGNNMLEIAANNNDGSDYASAVVNRKIKQNILLPVVSLMKPMLATSTSTNVNYNFNMAVINVSTQNDIEVTFNGVIQNNFSYNTTSTIVDFTSNLKVGNNVLTIKGTNANGSDSKTINVIYEPVIIAKKPPVITFITPAINSTTVTNLSYTYKTSITNVFSKNDLIVIHNGSVISNYIFNGNVFEFTTNLNNGSNILEITASNPDGVDNKNADVTFKPIAVSRPPVVVISSPSANTPTVSNSNFTFNFTTVNAIKNQINVTLNNQIVSNFSFIGINGTFLKQLQNGLNTLVITATNNDGVDSRTATVYYDEPLVTQTLVTEDTTNKKVTICHIPPGNNQNPQTITISVNALAAHLAHGDAVGACVTNSSNSVNTTTIVSTTTTTTTTSVTVTTSTTTSTNSGNSGDTVAKKVTICHIPPGNNQNPQTITISVNALPAHLAHGDAIGECPNTQRKIIKPNNGGGQSGNIKVNTDSEINKTNIINQSQTIITDTIKKTITEPVKNIGGRPR